MRTRLTTLVLALLMGAVGVTLVYMYVSRVETESTQGLVTRPVLVANRSIPAGTTGTDIAAAEAFDVKEVPQRYIAPGAFTSPEQLANLTLADDIAAGEQLTSSRFATSQTAAFLEQFPKGTEALALPLDYVKGVAGHVRPGDRINAYVTASGGLKRGGGRFVGLTVPSSARVFGSGGKTVLLLPKLQVIEVPVPAQGQPASTMVLAVSPQEAAILIHAQQTATLWFTLVPQDGLS